MNVRPFAFIIFSMSFMIFFQPSVGFSDYSSGTFKKFQFNAFYGETFGISPSSINQKIDDLNTGANKILPKLKSSTLIGGEVINVPSANFQLGIRYTIQRTDTTQGSTSSSVNQIVVDVQDIAGVAKYVFDNEGRLHFNFGGLIGLSLINDIIITDIGSKTKYSSPNGLVARGFGGIRYNLGIVAFWGEAGYQYLKDKAYKSEQGAAPTSSTGAVTLDFSGTYALGGIGIQF